MKKTITYETARTALHALYVRRDDVRKFLVSPADEEARVYWELRFKEIVAAIAELERA